MSVTVPSRDAAATVAGAIPPATWRRALTMLWLGQVISHLGDSLFLVGIFFLALEITGSKAMSGLLVAMNFLPALALGIFAGALVDRHDRLRVMIFADVLRAVAVGFIPVLYFTGHLGTAALGAAMFGLATGTTLFNPAIKALIPEIAPVERLSTAVSVFQISEYVALVAGPALAAVIIPHVTMVHLFSLDCASFLVSALCLMAIPSEARRLMHAQTHGRPAGPLGTLLAAILKEVKVGLRAVLSNPVLRGVLGLAALNNLIVMGLAHVGTPLLIKERLGLGPEAYARAQAFFFLGLAAASAGIWVAGRRLPKGPLILVGILLDGLTFVPLAFCQSLGQVQLALLVHAMSIPLIIIPRTVLIQQTVPGPLHGRTFALLNVTVFGMTAISSAVVGVLAEKVPPQTLFVVFGLLGALVGVGGFAIPSVRNTR